ncbi:MAG: CBS domain-containing protein [Candidatus Binataceae bacterium]
MEVKRIMVHDVKTCGLYDSLNKAAQFMWEHACGCLPIVDGQNRPVGFITDRDICMAAYIHGHTLSALRVEDAMARQVVSCHPDDEIDEAAKIMCQNGLRRLPVVNGGGQLVGLLSIDDLACESQRNLRGGINQELAGLIGRIYGSICSMRCRRRHNSDPPAVGSIHT